MDVFKVSLPNIGIHDLECFKFYLVVLLMASETAMMKSGGVYSRTG